MPFTVDNNLIKKLISQNELQSRNRRKAQSIELTIHDLLIQLNLISRLDVWVPQKKTDEICWTAILRPICCLEI